MVVEFIDKSVLKDKNGQVVSFGDEVVYATGTSSYVDVYKGKITRATDKIAFMTVDEPSNKWHNGMEIEIRKSRRLLKL